jgi:hypothetical protein
MNKNLSIRLLSYLLILILGINYIPSIDYNKYTKQPLKKVSNLDDLKTFQEYEEYLESVKKTMEIVKARSDKLKQFKKAKKLSDEDLAILLYLVGFEGKNLKTAWAVAKKESNGRPLAYNGNTKTGDNSYGIFQINMIGSLGPERREKFGLKHNKELLNPVTNAEIAFHMSGKGSNWSAWKGMTPRTQSWLQEFPTIDLSPYKIS